MRSLSSVRAEGLGGGLWGQPVTVHTPAAGSLSFSPRGSCHSVSTGGDLGPCRPLSRPERPLEGRLSAGSGGRRGHAGGRLWAARTGGCQTSWLSGPRGAGPCGRLRSSFEPRLVFERVSHEWLSLLQKFKTVCHQISCPPATCASPSLLEGACCPSCFPSKCGHGGLGLGVPAAALLLAQPPCQGGEARPRPHRDAPPGCPHSLLGDGHASASPGIEGQGPVPP